MVIKGGQILLREIKESDLELLHLWANDEQLWSLLDGWHFPYSKASTQHWFESLDYESSHRVFGIEVPKIGLIGTANLVQIDPVNKSAFHGMMIGSSEQRGKGFGQDTIRTVVRYAFESLRLKRLETSIIEYNEASLRTYLTKCGWKEEARLRQFYFRKNRYWDKILIATSG